MAVLLLALQLGLWLLLVAASVHLLLSARFAWNRPLAGDDDDLQLDLTPGRELPMVTVQLPVRNEGALAERVARAAAALDWPRDRLEIQLLDDSDAHEEASIDGVARALRAEGHDVRVLRRQTRAG